MLELIKLKAQMKRSSTKLAEQLEKRNARDTKIKQLRDALEEAVTEEDITAVEEQITAVEEEYSGIDEQVQQLESEVEELKGKIEELESKEPETGSDPAAPAEEEERSINMSHSKRGAFYKLPAETRAKILKRDDVKSFVVRTREIIKNQTRGITGAELAVPTVLLDIVREHVWEASKLIDKVRSMTIGGNARQPVTGSIPEAIWTDALGAFNEDQIDLRAIDMDAYLVSAFVPVPNSIIEDTDEAFLGMILDFLAGGIGRATDKAIIYGLGNGMPLGIVTRLAQSARPSDWSSNAPEWADLRSTNIKKLDILSKSGAEFFADLGMALAAAENNGSNAAPFWCMNRKTKMELRTKALSFDASAALRSGIDNTLPFDDGEIVELDFIPDHEIVGGYGLNYLLAERQGVSLGSSEHVRFIQRQTVFAGFARYDGAPVFGNSFVVVNYGNAEPTTVTTFAGDAANTDRVSLTALTVGTAQISPAFNKDILNYSVEVDAAKAKVTATAQRSEAVIEIKNGAIAVTNGSEVTFAEGNNVLTFKVTNGNAVARTYSVTVKYTKA